jgi:hypothetical protein
MTRVAETLARALASQPKPVLSNYDIFRELWIIYQSGTAKYLRGETPSREVSGARVACCAAKGLFGRITITVRTGG